MSGPIGEIPEYNGEDWAAFLERLDQYFEVNKVDEVQRVGLLINAIGAETYQILRDLCHPNLPKEKSFAELCKLLGNHMNPPLSVFRERSTFYNAQQDSDESITAWFRRIKGLAVDCKFGSNNESVLVDKFITGLKPGPVADRLREENETVSLQIALDIALNKEAAAIGDVESTADSSSDDDGASNRDHEMRRGRFGRRCGRHSSRDRSPRHGPPKWSHFQGGPPHWFGNSHHGPSNWGHFHRGPHHRRGGSPHHGPPSRGCGHHRRENSPHHGGRPDWSASRGGPPHRRESSPHHGAHHGGCGGNSPDCAQMRPEISKHGHGKHHFGKCNRGKHGGRKVRHHGCHHGEHHHRFGRENLRV